MTLRSLHTPILRIVTFIAALLAATPALASNVQDFVRIKGQGSSVLRGVGIVVGLSGTGDSAKEAAVARPLAKVLENEGAAVGLLKELEKGKNTALVFLTAEIPEEGRLTDDRIDVVVSAAYSASSLRGGRLYIAPLRGPLPGSGVYAFAEGGIEIEDSTTLTVGRVRLGARMVKDVRMPDVGDTFDLLIHPHFAGWAAAQQVASAINTEAQALGPEVARVVDARTIRVTVPAAERPNRAAFIADVLGAPVNVQLMGLPAMVVVNSRTGAIVVTGDVTISPGVITHKDLTITTVNPPPQPTAIDPQIERSRWAPLQTGAQSGEKARLSDLLAAFKQLDIPVTQQIEILEMLHKAGRLNAKLIRE